MIYNFPLRDIYVLEDAILISETINKGLDRDSYSLVPQLSQCAQYLVSYDT